MAICDTCARARAKLTHSNWIECKIRDIPPCAIMQAYEDFITQKGQIESPFHLVAMVQTTAEHAWPFQFDPQVIVECAGYTDKK